MSFIKFAKFIFNHFLVYLRSLSSVFLLKNELAGAGLLALVGLFDLRALAFTVGASLIGYVSTIRYSTPHFLTQNGLPTLNGFFYGLAMATLFESTLPFFAFLVIGAIALPLITKACYEVLQHWKLSPLVLPYTLAVWLVWLCRDRAGLVLKGTEAIPLDPDMSLRMKYTSATLTSMGDLLFMRHPLFGLMILALILVHSQRRGIYFLAGSLAATLTAAFLTPLASTYSNITLCSSAALVGLALASFPERFTTRRILFYCALSTVVTMALEGLLTNLELPVLTLPYVVTFWIASLGHGPRLNVSWAPRDMHRKSLSFLDSEPPKLEPEAS